MLLLRLYNCNRFEFVFTVVKSTMPSYEKLQCRLTAPYIICGLWRWLAKKENQHRWSPQHVQLLRRDWTRQSSQVQDQSICMVHIFAGGTNTRVRTPGKWAPWWCTNSRANLCARCTFSRGERIRCYTGNRGTCRRVASMASDVLWLATDITKGTHFKR